MHYINFYRLENNMKLVSWNVNGIRACITKGFEESFAKLDADIFCLQVIINIGIMRTARDIPEQLFLQKKNRCPCPTDLE